MFLIKILRGPYAGFIVATFCLIGMIVTWVAMAEIVQAVQSGSGDKYNKAYFMSYLVHSSYTLFFIIWLFIRPLHYLIQRRSSSLSAPSSPYPLRRTPSQRLREEREDCEEREEEREGESLIYIVWGKELRKFALKSFIFSVASFAIVYTWYLSLPLTPVSVNTAIYNAACAFVFVFSVILLKERITLLKCVAVCFCIGGVVLLCISELVLKKKDDHKKDGKDKDDEENNVWGYVLVIASTIGYSLYEVAYKRFFESPEEAADPTKLADKVATDIAVADADADAVAASEEDLLISASREADSESYTAAQSSRSINTEYIYTSPPPQPVIENKKKKHKKPSMLQVTEECFLILGLIGVGTALLTWPGIIVVHYSGIEHFQLPPVGKPLFSILISMGLDALFNLLLLLGILLSTPLYISVGTLLTIPASVLADFILHGKLLSGIAFGGIGCILIGFIVLNCESLVPLIIRKLRGRPPTSIVISRKME